MLIRYRVAWVRDIEAKGQLVKSSVLGLSSGPGSKTAHKPTDGVLRQDQRRKVCRSAYNSNCNSCTLRKPIETTKLLSLFEALVNKVPAKIARHPNSKFSPHIPTIAASASSVSPSEVLAILQCFDHPAKGLNPCRDAVQPYP
jgi:hypothetical protein